MIYIWDLLVFLFMKSSICTISAYSEDFLACKLCISGLKNMPVISEDFRFMASVDIGDF